MKKLTAMILTAAALLLCACSQGGQSVQKKLSEVWNDIKQEVSFEDFNEYTSVKNLDRHYGITEDMVEEFAGGINGSGVNQEEIVLVKAKDSDSAVKIKNALDTRFKSKLNQNKSYNAVQAKMIEGCKVERSGTYVAMIVSGNAEKIAEIYHKETNTGQ